MKFDTKVVRAGIVPDPTTGSILPPIYETATYVLPEVGQDKGFAGSLKAFVATVISGGAAPIDEGELLEISRASIRVVESLRSGKRIEL